MEVVKLSRCLTPGNGEIMEGTKRGVGGSPGTVISCAYNKGSTVRYGTAVVLVPCHLEWNLISEGRAGAPVVIYLMQWVRTAA